MDLKTYFKNHSQVDLAKEIRVTPGAVNQWISGFRPVPIKFAVAIEAATNKQVTRKDLFPSDWQLIWPELCAAS
jgi:DNA-binding transcriptional regulator YdaS (Cro superfamily)